MPDGHIRQIDGSFNIPEGSIGKVNHPRGDRIFSCSIIPDPGIAFCAKRGCKNSNKKAGFYVPDNDKSDAMNAPNRPLPDGVSGYKFPFVEENGALIELLSGVTLRINPYACIAGITVLL